MKLGPGRTRDSYRLPEDGQSHETPGHDSLVGIPFAGTKTWPPCPRDLQKTNDNIRHRVFNTPVKVRVECPVFHITLRHPYKPRTVLTSALRTEAQSLQPFTSERAVHVLHFSDPTHVPHSPVGGLLWTTKEGVPAKP